MTEISRAAQDALDSCSATRGHRFGSVKFASVWIGMAGYSRPALAPVIDAALTKLLGTPIGKRLKVTSDVDLIPAVVATRADVDHVIVLIAGTGSIAMSYKLAGGQYQQLDRAGGWGHLLGDDGSGYQLGREGIRKALFACDIQRIFSDADEAVDPLSLLSNTIVEHFQSQYPGCSTQDLLSTVVAPEVAPSQREDSTLAATKRIASVAKVVLGLAGQDRDAKDIVHKGAQSLAMLVTLLTSQRKLDTTRVALFLAGGLMQNVEYKEAVIDAVEAKAGKFQLIETVTEPALEAAKVLLAGIKANV